MIGLRNVRREIASFTRGDLDQLAGDADGNGRRELGDCELRSVGLFADQEIRLLNGPLFVDQDYELEREVVALSGSRRTESLWVRTTVFDGAAGASPVATMLLNHAILKDS